MEIFWIISIITQKSWLFFDETEKKREYSHLHAMPWIFLRSAEKIPKKNHVIFQLQWSFKMWCSFVWGKWGKKCTQSLGEMQKRKHNHKHTLSVKSHAAIFHKDVIEWYVKFIIIHIWAHKYQISTHSHIWFGHEKNVTIESKHGGIKIWWVCSLRKKWKRKRLAAWSISWSNV